MAYRHGVWAYAITEHADPGVLRDVRGVAGGPVRTVEAAELTAVAETVPLDEFGESALRRNLEDLDWLEAVARAHHQVIDAVARHAPIIPMRLATVYRSEDTLAAMLEERGPDFRGALRRIGTRREWGVKAYAASPEAGEGAGGGRASGGTAASGSTPADDNAAASGGTAPVRTATRAPAGSGAAYLRRRRDQISAAKDARRSAVASAQAVHGALSRLAADTRLHPPQAPQLTGSRAPMLLNASYLLDDASSDEFAAAVTALGGQHPGVRLELTGPWPPYSFAGTAGGEDAK